MVTDSAKKTYQSWLNAGEGKETMHQLNRASGKDYYLQHPESPYLSKRREHCLQAEPRTHVPRLECCNDAGLSNPAIDYLPR